MSRIQNRIKQRRAYLRKKGAAYTLLGITVSQMIPCALITMVLLILTFVFSLIQVELAYLPALVVGFLYFLWFSGVSANAVRKAYRAAKQLPYVPPVTPTTLPNEEVLLRSSDASVQEQSQVLLRGMHNSEEADGQELLRSSQGHD